MDLKALDEFVNLPDPHYNYTFINRKILPYFSILIHYDTINMTSQKWLDKSEVDKVVWSHTLKIAVPKFRSRRKSISESCLLMITTDQNDGFISDKTFTNVALTKTAVGAKSVVAILSGALFQPLTFKNDPLRCKNVTGYDIVACSWRMFMNDSTAPAHVLVQFPIVKAVVRAMDTITDYVKKEYGHNVTKFTLAGMGLAVVRAMDTITDYVKKEYRHNVTKFTIAGLGLGGWISWLTAAVDKRVEAIAPVAMDFLNFTKNTMSDIANVKIQKYIIVLSGDEFFPPDNSRYYFPQLEGKKYLL
uniref:Uncharacterized protein n=1 Tax=Sphaerodactylus townsendi TaxID=933632 RepID=A0ACB8FFG7_9SAUR